MNPENSNFLLPFTRLKETKQPILLLNTYRGLSISNEAWIENVDDGYLTLSTYASQVVSIFLEGKTRLQSSLFPEAYQATAVNVDIVEKKIILTELSSLGPLLDKRRVVRVQPEDLINVEIQLGEERIPGKLADVSLRGLGVYTFSTFLYAHSKMDEWPRITVSLELPGAAQDKQLSLRAHGKVIYTTHSRDPRMQRVGIQVEPDMAVEQILKQFVEIRQQQLLHELDFIYESMLQMRQQNPE